MDYCMGQVGIYPGPWSELGLLAKRFLIDREMMTKPLNPTSASHPVTSALHVLTGDFNHDTCIAKLLCVFTGCPQAWCKVEAIYIFRLLSNPNRQSLLLWTQKITKIDLTHKNTLNLFAHLLWEWNASLWWPASLLKIQGYLFLHTEIGTSASQLVNCWCGHWRWSCCIPISKNQITSADSISSFSL